VTLRDTALLDVSTRSATWRKIDCGSAAAPASGWESDNALATGGSAWINPGSVSVSGVTAAAPAAVYKNVRAGVNHSYAVTGLPVNMYTIRMHFADAFDSVRTMSYSIQSANVLRDFSIASAAGGANKALVMDFPADLRSAGNLAITCQGTGSSTAMEAGIEVMENKSTAITLLSPDGGEKMSVGQKVVIRWYADTIKLQQVYVELSTNDGVDWALISGSRGLSLSQDRAQWGALEWTIPATIVDQANQTISTVSGTCLVRIRPYFANSGVANAISAAPFEIQQKAGVDQRGARATAAPSLVSHQLGGMLRLSVAGSGAHTVDLLDARGALILRLRGSGCRDYQVPRSAIPAGTYLAKMTSGTKVLRSKVVIE
jgi:hypothetical protein